MHSWRRWIISSKASSHHCRWHASGRSRRPAAAYFLRFDFNPINLRKPQVESIATFLDLRKDPNTGCQRHQCDDEFGIRGKKNRSQAEQLPEVLSVRSLNSFVPEDQLAKLRLIAQGARILGPALNPESVDAAPSDDENVEAVEVIGGTACARPPAMPRVAGRSHRGGWPMPCQSLPNPISHAQTRPRRSSLRR